MTVYSFTVHLDQAPDGEGLDRLFESGLDDSQLVISSDTAIIMVSREAGTFTEAILNVVAEIEQAGFRATGIDSQDLVTLEVIGHRTGRTRESVRLLSKGKRGPGGFPSPSTTGKTPLWSWAAVREWFRTHYGDEVAGVADRDADTLAAADLLIRARLIAPAVRDLSPLVDA
ncbi:MAG: hypothetical protein LBM23_03610 [Propionibacteriaceae bacterium]|jgi:hypothetical protein|nr:hypothetical protein [Propionibacteriaceae bacterium]